MTTTDGEPQDSLDLIDELTMSPPPVSDNPNSNNNGNNGHQNDHVYWQESSVSCGSDGTNIGVDTTINSTINSNHQSILSSSENVPAPNNSTASYLKKVNSKENFNTFIFSQPSVTNLNLKNKGKALRMLDDEAIMATAAAAALSKTDLGLDSPSAPPPTPLVGAHQELRFTFNTKEFRPELPELKAIDFFR